MALSRRRRRGLKKLKGNAHGLWSEQQSVLAHANEVLQQASKELGALNREQVAPHVKTAYEKRIEPTVRAGVGAAAAAKHRVTDDLVPAAVAAVGSLGVVETVRKALEDADLQRTVEKTGKKVQKRAKAAGKSAKGLQKNARSAGKAAVKAAKKRTGHSSGPGAGSVVLLSLGVLALAGVGYAVWQTLRADDDLWVADDEPETPVS